MANDASILPDSLDESQELFYKAFNASPGLFAISNLNTGEHYAVSERWLATLGYERREVIGRTSLELGLWVDPNDRTRLVDEVRAVGHVRDFPARFYAKNSKVHDFLISAESVRIDGQSRLLIVAHDVTDLNRARRELEMANENMAMQIKERTALLMQEIEERRWTEEELKRAWANAELSNKAKSQFLAHMSHELRTPLNAVIGYSDALKSGIFGAQANAKQTEYIEAIHRSGQYLLVLISDLLDLSAIEAGKFELDDEEVDLRQCCDGSLHLVKIQAASRGVEIIADISGDLPLLLIDKRRISQVVINILSNAIKATPKGGSVRLTTHLKEDDSAEIIIVDAGIGMDEKGIAAALTPFERGNPEIRRKDQGTGLGVPISKMIMEAHGGALKIESKLGTGTTVRLHLPSSRLIRRI